MVTVLLSRKSRENGYIRIPARATSGAMDNDRVVARMENRQKRDGTIIRILERAHVRVAGRLEIENAVSYVRPKNKSIAFDLYVSPNDRGSARNGDTVIAEILTYPADRKPPSGRIVKVIEKPEDPASEVEAIIDEFSIREDFREMLLKKQREFGVSLLSFRAKRRNLVGCFGTLSLAMTICRCLTTSKKKKKRFKRASYGNN